MLRAAKELRACSNSHYWSAIVQLKAFAITFPSLITRQQYKTIA